MSEANTLAKKLDELIFWTKFSALPAFRALIMDNLRTDIDKLVYELSNGERSTREIAAMISRGGRRISHVTISNAWQKWSILNLVMPAERRGRYKKVVSLESIGIKVPPLEMVSEEGEEEP